jgi:hypothetical protein
MEPTFNEVNLTEQEAEAAAKAKVTIGQRVVGVDFNPSGDEKINKVKELCAEMIDLMNQHMIEKSMKDGVTSLHSVIQEHAMCEVLNAQMSVVKVLTFKY